MKRSSSAEMPFLEHLEELRWRILWSLLALAIGVIIGFFLVIKFDVIGLLARPITPFMQGQKLVFTHPGEPFGITMKASLLIGMIFALPVIAYQVWGFVSPALYKHEKKVVIPVLAGATFLFAGGVALAYFVVLPLTLGFLLGLQTESLESMIKASDYFGFAISMSLAFGVTFELPIVIVALSSLGIISAKTLQRYRRHAVVLCFVGGALITPGGDVMSMLALALPLYLLFEFSIVLATLIDRRRARRIAREAAEDAAERARESEDDDASAPRSLMV
ncbi:MAG TPA: twin-arginine translocase subunit TatC [Gemmatimonadaceae bacterium]|nr:twin-arginine translocase subunit TatC [Gemmatimonadaceae bacterium]